MRAHELVDAFASRLAGRRADQEREARPRVTLEDPPHDLASEKPGPARQEDVVPDSGGSGDRLPGCVSVHALPFESGPADQGPKARILSALESVDQEDVTARAQEAPLVSRNDRVMAPPDSCSTPWIGRRREGAPAEKEVAREPQRHRPARHHPPLRCVLLGAHPRHRARGHARAGPRPQGPHAREAQPRQRGRDVPARAHAARVRRGAAAARCRTSAPTR